MLFLLSDLGGILVTFGFSIATIRVSNDVNY